MFNTEQAFAIKVFAAVLVGGWFIFWAALRQGEPRRWLLAYVLIAISAIIGARLTYVAFNFEFFREFPDYIPRLWFGELMWQGGIIGGAVMLVVVVRWVEARPFADALALAVPVIFMGTWFACRSAGCGLGQPVANLNDQPVWAASFLPDIFRSVAPRYELQMLGVGLSSGILSVAVAFTYREMAVGKRLWIVLILLAIMMRGMAEYTALPATRFDTIFTLVVIGVAVFFITRTSADAPA